ncbi:hypothetical protein ACHAQA_007973 [Verticillium albo-atrum]
MSFKAALLASATLAAAQVRPGVPILECSGLQQPDWSACDDLVDGLGWAGSSVPFNPEGSCDGICMIYNFDNSARNCKIDLCWKNAHCLEISESMVHSGYESVKDRCSPLGGGGSTPIMNENLWIYVTHDPGFASGGSKRSVAVEDVETKVEAVSWEEFVDRWEEEEESTTLIQPLNETKAADVEKRQSPDDDSFFLLTQAESVVKPGEKFAFGPTMQGGASYEVSDSESESVSISVSTSMGLTLFGVFTASVGISETKDKTTTTQTGISIPVNCEPSQNGQIYFEPYYDYYHGSFQPSGEEVTFWIPVERGPNAAGRWTSECFGA